MARMHRNLGECPTCRRVLMSSMGEVTAAARPPLRLPLSTFISREAFLPSPTMAVLMGVYRPRRAPTWR